MEKANSGLDWREQIPSVKTGSGQMGKGHHTPTGLAMSLTAAVAGPMGATVLYIMRCSGRMLTVMSHHWSQ